MIKDFTPELPFFPLVTLAVFLILGIVVAIRLRQRGPLVSWAAFGLVIFAGASQAIEACLGYTCSQLQWSDGFYRQSDCWQLGWLIVKLACVGLFSFGLVRGLSRPASSGESPPVHAT